MIGIAIDQAYAAVRAYASVSLLTVMYSAMYKARASKKPNAMLFMSFAGS